MDQISRMKTRYVLAVSCVFFAAAALYVLSNSSSSSTPPGIEEVLKGTAASFNWSFALLGILGLSLSTLSIAKAFDVIKKMPKPEERPAETAPAPDETGIRAELEFVSAQFRQKSEESAGLSGEIKRLQEVVRERIESEDVLKKSNASLRRECEKLVVEKEKLALEASRKEWPELSFAPPEKKAKKTKRASLNKKVKPPKKSVKRRK